MRAAGVVGASRALHLTPQAVSQQIATLEDELGVPLFDRTHRRLAPTAVGLTLAAHAERVEAELVAAGRAVAAATGRAAGIVRIAAFQSAIRWLVVEAIPVLRAEQPGVIAMVIELDGQGVGAALRTGEVDLVVDERDDGEPEPGARGIAIHLLRRDPYHIVAPSTIGAAATINRSMPRFSVCIVPTTERPSGCADLQHLVATDLAKAGIQQPDGTTSRLPRFSHRNYRKRNHADATTPRQARYCAGGRTDPSAGESCRSK